MVIKKIEIFGLCSFVTLNYHRLPQFQHPLLRGARGWAAAIWGVTVPYSLWGTSSKQHAPLCSKRSSNCDAHVFWAAAARTILGLLALCVVEGNSFVYVSPTGASAQTREINPEPYTPNPMLV